LVICVVALCACATEESPAVAEHEAALGDTTGWSPGGVLDGAFAEDIECSMCSGDDPCGTACVEANGDETTCGVAGPACAAIRVNVAAASALAQASASSAYSTGTGPSTAIDGDRRGTRWGAGGGWSDATNNVFPDRLEVAFYGGAKPISEVDVYTLQDACGDAPSTSTCLEPTTTMTFTKWGVTDFRVQAWNGSAFVDVATVTGNTLVKRQLELSPPVTTSKLRVVVDHARGLFSRIVEIEAWQDQSAFDPYLTQAINSRITMSGATGCESSPHATTIGGITGYYKHCNYAWVVASPGNGAWLLPQSHISNRYLGGAVWPATPTAVMTNMGFPKGPYHGSDADDSYVVFARGVVAKSNSSAVAKKIGGLPDQAANEALAKTWLASNLANKYPDLDTYTYTQGNATGIRFSTEPNAAGYDSSFVMRAGTSAVFRIDGAIEDTWMSATAAERLSLGFPISNELRVASNGSAISQFTGGAIVWRPTSCNTTTFTAQILTAQTGQPTPIHADGLAGMTCGEKMQVCVDGPETPFTSPDGVNGTYQFLCGGEAGWWDRLSFTYEDPDLGTLSHLVKAPILGRYLSTNPIVIGAPPISVEQALASGLGRPRSNAFGDGANTNQLFERGEIIEARPCSSVCTASIACDRSCVDAGARITCGDYTPPGFEAGTCQLYDVYCELPEITDARVLDNSEHELEKLGGPTAFFYYKRPGVDDDKRGRMPVQIGGVGGVPASDYANDIWAQALAGIQSHPELYPFASNLPGRSSVFDIGPLQLEFTASHWSSPEIAHRHPVLAARQCITLPHQSYGVHPPIPTFVASSLHHVYEDDECLMGICNPDDYIGSIRLYHNACRPEHWSAGRDFGFTALRTLTNQSPSENPDLGGPGTGGSEYIDLAHYRTYCYRGLNVKRGGDHAIDTWEYGIGTQEHSGFIEP
jgi:hypothetical protein